MAGARRGRDRLARDLLLEHRLALLGPQQREAFASTAAMRRAHTVP